MLIEALEPGDILCIDALGLPTAGIIGDILSARILARGAAAAIVHGAVRDAPFIKGLGLPVFCATAHPSHSGRDLMPVDYDAPIDMGGVQVVPVTSSWPMTRVRWPCRSIWRSASPRTARRRNSSKAGFARRSRLAAQSTTTTHRSPRSSPSTRPRPDGQRRTGATKGPCVKITDVRTAEIRGHGYSTYVRIYTDEGLIGNGECIHGGEGCPAMVHALKHYIIGENPLNVDMLFEKMRRAHAVRWRHGRRHRHRHDRHRDRALGPGRQGAGRARLPAAGRQVPRTVRLYCDSHAGKDFSPEAYAERAREVVAMGFDALKFDVDETRAGVPQRPLELARLQPREIDWMVERVAAVREAVGPNVDLAIDMHGRYDIASGIAVAQGDGAVPTCSGWRSRCRRRTSRPCAR